MDHTKRNILIVHASFCNCACHLCRSWSETLKTLKLSRDVRKATFWFLTWSDTNQAAQPHKMARSLKFCIGSRWIVLYIYVAKTKGLISFAVTAKLICLFVFAYAKCWFSHEATQMMLEKASMQESRSSVFLSM